MYGAWHHPRYVKDRLLKDFELLEDIPADFSKYGIFQDIWIAKKRIGSIITNQFSLR